MQALVAAEDSARQLAFVQGANAYLQQKADQQKAEACACSAALQLELATTKAHAQMLQKDLAVCQAECDAAQSELAASHSLAQLCKAEADGLRKELETSMAMHGEARTAAESAVGDSQSEVTPAQLASYDICVMLTVFMATAASFFILPWCEWTP